MQLPTGASKYGVAWVFGQRRARLATVNSAGDPHCVPVIYGYDPKRGELAFLTAADSRKVRDIRQTSKAALAVDDEHAMRGVSLSGAASVVADPGDRQRWVDWLTGRGLLSGTRDFSEQVVVVVQVQRWAEWGLAVTDKTGPAEPAAAPS